VKTHLTVEVEGRRLVVEVTETGGRLDVVVDGESQLVDAVRIEPNRWSLIAGSARRSRDVRVRHGRDGAWTVFVEGMPIKARVPNTSRSRAAGADVGAAAGPFRLTAPMPGRVVRVLAARGDTVSARQPLIVVEAMKMENELRAPRPGTIGEVLVREGASVETGAPLMIIE
jgi:biotin carboxyl carrier protein